MSVHSLFDTALPILEGSALECLFSSSSNFSNNFSNQKVADLATSLYPSFQAGASSFSSCSCASYSTLDAARPSAQFARPEPSVSPVLVVDSPPPTYPSVGAVLESGLVPKPEFPAGDTPGNFNPITIGQVSFSFQEGAAGSLQIQLTQAPISDVTISFTGGDFLVVDADGEIRSGTQTSITIAAETWQQPRTIWFMAENDGVSTDRTSGNTIYYALSGGLTFSGVYDLGTIANTYAPDLTCFNINLDFRNDFFGFWTPERQAIAQKAANAWANWIADRWSGFQLNHAIELFDNGFPNQSTFTTKRYVDDVVVFVNSINSGGLVGGYGGPEYQFGGWTTPVGSMPRVGQIAIDTSISDIYLYNAVLHELGHVLGLVGMNWAGYLQQDLSSPQAAVFQGYYATAANGGNPIPLQSQDGPNSVTGTYNYYHPASEVVSVMSYGWLYTVTGPTAIDYAMLADSGYRIYGINA